MWWRIRIRRRPGFGDGADSETARIRRWRGRGDDLLGEKRAPGRTRTCDQRIRNPLLYPAELRGRCSFNTLKRGGRLETSPRLLVRPSSALATPTPPLFRKSNEKSGRGERIRTSDTLLPKQVRYRTAPHPECEGIRNPRRARERVSTRRRTVRNWYGTGRDDGPAGRTGARSG